MAGSGCSAAGPAPGPAGDRDSAASARPPAPILPAGFSDLTILWVWGARDRPGICSRQGTKGPRSQRGSPGPGVLARAVFSGSRGSSLGALGRCRSGLRGAGAGPRRSPGSVTEDPPRPRVLTSGAPSLELELGQPWQAQGSPAPGASGAVGKENRPPRASAWL